MTTPIEKLRELKNADVYFEKGKIYLVKPDKFSFFVEDKTPIYVDVDDDYVVYSVRGTLSGEEKVLFPLIFSYAFRDLIEAVFASATYLAVDGQGVRRMYIRESGFLILGPEPFGIVPAIYGIFKKKVEMEVYNIIKEVYKNQDGVVQSDTGEEVS